MHAKQTTLLRDLKATQYQRILSQKMKQKKKNTFKLYLILTEL